MAKSIVIAIGSLGGGGAERVCITLCNELVCRNWKVVLLVVNLNNSVLLDELNKKVRIVCFNKARARHILIPLFIFLLKEKPNKIFSFEYEISIILVILRYFFKRSFKIISRHINNFTAINKENSTSIYKIFKSLITNIFYKKVDILVAQCEEMKSDILKNYSFDENRLVVIYNPVRPEIQNSAQKKSNQTPRKKNRPIVLYVGRLEIQKNILELLEIMSICKKSIPDILLLIVGNGSQLGKIRQKISELNLVENVNILNFTPVILEYYFKCDLVVLTSIYEGFPNVLVEAATLGIPIVSYKCPYGPEEIVEDGINGYLLEVHDKIGFAAAIIKTIELKRTIKPSTKFYYQNIVDSYEKLFIN
jgi:glycosyltransferase involved in cell wall biosynthesis